MISIEKLWYQRHFLSYLLLPLSGLYCFIVMVRRMFYQLGLFSQTKFSVPVIVVGNITVGGTGKTPLVQNLIQYFQQQGYKPAIISRGYGGASTQWPVVVEQNSDAALVGDEPVLLARQCHCPIVVGPSRVEDVKYLLSQYDCDLIIADDGLQHYALGRCVEIAVLDGQRHLGNGFCLPAGPLRETKRRLRSVDLVVVNQGQWPGAYGMQLEQTELINVKNNTLKKPIDAFINEGIHAVAGIGYPQRFFDQLRTQGYTIEEHAFADHHHYVAQDFEFGLTQPVIMTEKDAVKCQSFAADNHWYVGLKAVLDLSFYQKIEEKLRRFHG